MRSDLEINNLFEEAEACQFEDPNASVITVLDEYPKGASWSMGKKVELWHEGKHKTGVVNKDVLLKAMASYEKRNRIILNDSTLTPRVGQNILILAWNLTQGIAID